MLLSLRDQNIESRRRSLESCAVRLPRADITASTMLAAKSINTPSTTRDSPTVNTGSTRRNPLKRKLSQISNNDDTYYETTLTTPNHSPTLPSTTFTRKASPPIVPIELVLIPRAYDRRN